MLTLQSPVIIRCSINTHMLFAALDILISFFLMKKIAEIKLKQISKSGMNTTNATLIADTFSTQDTFLISHE